MMVFVSVKPKILSAPRIFYLILNQSASTFTITFIQGIRLVPSAKLFSKNYGTILAGLKQTMKKL